MIADEILDDTVSEVVARPLIKSDWDRCGRWDPTAKGAVLRI